MHQHSQIQKLIITDSYKLNSKQQKTLQEQMLRVQPSQHYLKQFIDTHPKEGTCFIIPQKQIKTIEQLIDQILFTTFQKSQSLIIILLRRFVLDLVNNKLSIPFLEEIFQILKQYQMQIAAYKNHFFQLQETMFQQDKSCSKLSHSKLSHSISALQSLKEQKNNWSILVNPPHQSNNDFGQKLIISPSYTKLSKSLTMDIECYSEDSKYNFFTNHNDKQICSEYLTTSEDQKEWSQETAFKQLKHKIQQKLKIQPLVSAFNYGMKPKLPVIDYQEQLKQWKRVKQSILKQPSFHRALAAHELDQNLTVNKMKQNHYRQKIKSVIVKKRLSIKNSIL